VFDTVPSFYIPFAVLDLAFLVLFVPARTAATKAV